AVLPGAHAVDVRRARAAFRQGTLSREGHAHAGVARLAGAAVLDPVAPADEAAGRITSSGADALAGPRSGGVAAVALEAEAAVHAVGVLKAWAAGAAYAAAGRTSRRAPPPPAHRVVPPRQPPCAPGPRPPVAEPITPPLAPGPVCG